MVRRRITSILILTSIVVLVYGFPFSNIWTFICMLSLWALAAANERINELKNNSR